ncbi:MAG: hypothetical protein RBQ88_11630, partial [Desulfobulbus oligotrophicus]|nr:hypothetical protein [Desulfobulbus oligotrophicus]
SENKKWQRIMTKNGQVLTVKELLKGKQTTLVSCFPVFQQPASVQALSMHDALFSLPTVQNICVIP